MNNQEKPLWGASNNQLIILFAINAFVFIIINFLRLAYAVSYNTNAEAEVNFQQQILYWFVLHVKPALLLIKPFTLIVYMFAHYSVYTLIANTIWLWFFSYLLQTIADNKHLIPVYLYGGLLGGIVFLLASNLLFFNQNSALEYDYLLGASASVMAIAATTTTINPMYKMFTSISGGISVWVLALVFFVINIFVLKSSNIAFILANITGAIIGFLYGHQLKRGNDWGAWLYNAANYLSNLFTPSK